LRFQPKKKKFLSIDSNSAQTNDSTFENNITNKTSHAIDKRFPVENLKDCYFSY
jgi:hypothetical protein